MKKIKKISVRLSQEDFSMYVKDYIWHKERPEWTKLIYKQEIKTFSDYIRIMLERGIIN